MKSLVEHKKAMPEVYYQILLDKMKFMNKTKPEMISCMLDRYQNTHILV